MPHIIKCTKYIQICFYQLQLPAITHFSEVFHVTEYTSSYKTTLTQNIKWRRCLRDSKRLSSLTLQRHSMFDFMVMVHSTSHRTRTEMTHKRLEHGYVLFRRFAHTHVGSMLYWNGIGKWSHEIAQVLGEWDDVGCVVQKASILNCLLDAAAAGLVPGSRTGSLSHEIPGIGEGQHEDPHTIAILAKRSTRRSFK